jgi:hypothetical protein
MVIAHRLSTIRRATRIVVLEDGRITAIGSHEELLSTSPTYQRLYELQFLGGAENDFTAGCCRSHGGRPIATATQLRPLFAWPVSSMTGFARVAVEVSAQASYVLTLKSVNHRFLDLHLRLPSGLTSWRWSCAKLLKEQLLRGHVELTLQVERTAQAGGATTANWWPAYVAAFQAAAHEFELQGQPDLNVILRMPGVLQAESRPGRRNARLYRQPACWSMYAAADRRS